jgi:hypothetical protein
MHDLHEILTLMMSMTSQKQLPILWDPTDAYHAINNGTGVQAATA